MEEKKEEEEEAAVEEEEEEEEEAEEIETYKGVESENVPVLIVMSNRLVRILMNRMTIC